MAQAEEHKWRRGVGGILEKEVQRKIILYSCNLPSKQPHIKNKTIRSRGNVQVVVGRPGAVLPIWTGPSVLQNPGQKNSSSS